MKRQYIDFIPYRDNSISPVFEDEVTPSAHKSYLQNLESPHSKMGVVEDVSRDDTFYFDDESDESASANHFPEPASPSHLSQASSAYRSYPVAPSLQSSSSENLTNKPLILRKPRTIAQPIERQKDLSGYHPPKVPFINTNVEKRPLSKNIYGSQNIFELQKTFPNHRQPAAKPYNYPKKPIIEETPEQETEELIRVVEEPKKKSHAGVIFAVIASILLGAAAGVVIYLFFP